MSKICHCDREGCFNNELNCQVYPVSIAVSEVLRRKMLTTRTWDYHLCEECINGYYSPYIEIKNQTIIVKP